jgi:replicative DNA helicase
MMTLPQKIETIINRNSDADDKEIAFLLKQLLYEKDVQDFAQTDAKSIAELATETVNEIHSETPRNTAIKTGFDLFEKNFGGLRTGELIVVGGRPGMGKTMFLTNLARNISETTPVLYITLELSAQELTKRFLASVARLSVGEMNEQKFQDSEKNQLSKGCQKLSKLQLFIHDCCTPSIKVLKIQCEKQIKKANVQVVVIDYLQLITSYNRRINRTEEISYICRELKNLAKEHQVCVIVSSQLSRAVETRGYSKIPQLSDLRECGSIEQDADKVLFLHRPEYYGVTEDWDGNSTLDIMDIIVAKNRTGATGNFKLKYTPFIFHLDNLSPNFSSYITFSKDRLNELKEESETPF